MSFLPPSADSTELYIVMNEYLQRATPNEKDFLYNLVSNVQDRAPVTRPPTVEDIEAKLPYMMRISSIYTAPSNLDANGNSKPFLYWHLASLWLIDESELQGMASDVNAINLYLDNCVSFLKQCHRGILDVDFGLKVPRGNLRQAVFIRDSGRCILTGRDTALEAAHIWPYNCLSSTAAANTMSNRWHVAMRMIGTQRAAALRQYIRNAGDTEVLWNHILLSRDMHKCYDDGRLGLQPLGDETADGPIRVRVQWFNLPGDVPKYQCNRPVNPDAGTILSMYEPLNQECNTRYLDVNLTGGVVESGNVYQIRCATRLDRYKMFLALDSRWLLARVLFCAKAAGYNAEDLDKPPWPEDGLSELGCEIPVAAYIDSQRDAC